MIWPLALGLIQVVAGKPTFLYVYSHDWNDPAVLAGRIVALSLYGCAILWLWASHAAQLVSELHAYYTWIPRRAVHVQWIGTLLIIASAIGFLLVKPPKLL